MSLDLQEQYDKIYRYRYCYFKVNNVETAEDLTQETFLKYFTQTSYIDRGKPLAYLYTIARNLCVDFYRKPVEHAVDEEIINNDGVSTFETSFVIQETVKEAVKTLSMALQEVILLRFANDLGIGEIAGIMQISRFAVYRKLNLALHTLKTVLKKEDLG